MICAAKDKRATLGLACDVRCTVHDLGSGVDFAQSGETIGAIEICLNRMRLHRHYDERNTGEHMAASKQTALVKEKYTKSQILAELADKSGLSKKEVGTVLEGLSDIIERHVKKKSVGEFTLPGLLKITTVHKKAQKARKGINPFTKEETTFKAKPARTVVKVRPLKKLKEMAE